jgi:glycosyltransferase involved in cell wall biosynthesis
MNQGKKKIFICITKSNWGGAQKYVFDIATQLPHISYDTCVLLGGNGELKDKLEEKNIKTISLKNSQRDMGIKREFGLFFELYKIFKKESPDIIHLNSSKMGFVGALTGRICGVKKIIFTAHGWSFNEDRNLISKFIFKILQILTIIMSHKTIVVAEILKKQIPRKFRKKIIVIRNGISDIDFIEKNEARKIISGENLIPLNSIWVGTISELHKNKGLEYVIKAMAEIIGSVAFVLIGEGEERKNLEDLIKKLGAQNKIFLIGKIDNASKYLKAFDIFTLTSITEAFPYVLLEAGLASLPVIATNIGGIPEIIENKKTGLLIKTKNIDGIKSNVEEYLKSLDKYSSFGERLHEKIMTDFTKEKMVKNTIALYEMV